MAAIEPYATRVDGPSWPSLALRGVASVLFGIIAFARPGITLLALAIVFGAYAFVDGIAALEIAFHRCPVRHRWLVVFDGLFGIAAGIITLLWPGITLLALVFVMGIRFVAMGGFQLIAAGFGMRGEAVGSRVLLGLGGIASLLIGVLTLALPGVSALVLVTLLGIYAFVFGCVMLALGFQAWRVTRHLAAAPA